jgi:hypothetical protein
MGEPIPVPEGKDIYIKIPDGVFRCNINDGVFPEERRFFQKKALEPDEPHVIRYSEIAHVRNPTLSIKVHYPPPGRDEDVVIEFK